MLSQKMIKIDPKTGMLIFPIDQRWLNGEEYAFMLRHYKAYCNMYPDDMSLTDTGHPE